MSPFRHSPLHHARRCRNTISPPKRSRPLPSSRDRFAELWVDHGIASWLQMVPKGSQALSRNIRIVLVPM
eukprot:9096257-Alexandrium_andersonii.AAC.1